MLLESSLKLRQIRELACVPVFFCEPKVKLGIRFLLEKKCGILSLTEFHEDFRCGRRVIPISEKKKSVKLGVKS